MSFVKSGLRWLTMPIAIAAVVALAGLLASWAVSLADQRCVSMVADTCVESWHSTAVEWAIYVAIFFGVLTIPLLSAWIAPAYKKTTALVMGLLASIPFAVGYFSTNWDDLLLPALLAITACIIGTFVVWRATQAKVTTETNSV